MSNGIREQFVRDMQVAGLSAGTQGQYVSSVDLFFKTTWLSPEAVTEQDVQTFLIGLRERDVARETFRGYRFALECLFGNTLGRDWPLFTKKKLRAPSKQRLPQALTHAQCVALLGAVRSPVYRGTLGVMYGCGLRIGEAAAVTVKDIDAGRGVIRVVGKGNKERLAPLPEALLADLRRVWATHRHPVWLFASKRRSNHVDTGELYKVFARVRREQGLCDAVKPHALRHSFATRLMEQGVPAETVRILLGHASIKTTQTYLHLTEPIRRQVNQAVSSFSISLFD